MLLKGAVTGSGGKKSRIRSLGSGCVPEQRLEIEHKVEGAYSRAHIKNIQLYSITFVHQHNLSTFEYKVIHVLGRSQTETRIS